jgi:hypothetical protein
MDGLKQTFIMKCLNDYMNDVIETMRQAAKRIGIDPSGDALSSLSYVAAKDGNGAVANLSFKEYLRFVDMGVGRGHPLGGMASMKITLLSQKKSGSILVADRKRKPKKIYSKTAYGKLTWLENQLLYGFSEETKALLQQNMADKN